MSQHRQGTLLIVVAGVSALLATLALSFAYKVRAASTSADTIARIAQARMLANVAVAYSLYTCDNDNTGSPIDTTIATFAPVGGQVYILADLDDPKTFNAAWIKLSQGVAAGTLTALVGAGPSQGTNTSYDDRRLEPRYSITMTLTPKTTLNLAPAYTGTVNYTKLAAMVSP